MSKLIASFKSMHDAKETINELEKQGFHGAYLDAHDMFNTEFASEPLYGEMNMTPTLSSSLFTSVKNLHKRANRALNNCSLPVSTDNMGYDTSQINTRLIIESDDSNNKQIESILKNSGGNILH